MRPMFIRHRANTLAAIDDLKPGWGAEIDLRAGTKNRLRLSHDPWAEGDDFEDWLMKFAAGPQRGPLALNTKEDGLEDTILGLLTKYNVREFFFVDTPGPALIHHTAERGNNAFAVRLSEWETVQTVWRFEGRARWVWLDCFAEPLKVEDIATLKSAFRICLVSPELHGRPNDIARFAKLYEICDAVCGKDPSLWT